MARLKWYLDPPSPHQLKNVVKVRAALTKLSGSAHVQGGASFVDHFCYFFFVFVCHTVLSAPCSLVVTSWERADLLALLYVMFFVCFCHFPIWCPGSDVVFDCIDP